MKKALTNLFNKVQGKTVNQLVWQQEEQYSKYLPPEIVFFLLQTAQAQNINAGIVKQIIDDAIVICTQPDRAIMHSISEEIFITICKDIYNKLGEDFTFFFADKLFNQLKNTTLDSSPEIAASISALQAKLSLHQIYQLMLATQDIDSMALQPEQDVAKSFTQLYKKINSIVGDNDFINELLKQLITTIHEQLFRCDADVAQIQRTKQIYAKIAAINPDNPPDLRPKFELARHLIGSARQSKPRLGSVYDNDPTYDELLDFISANFVPTPEHASVVVPAWCNQLLQQLIDCNALQAQIGPTAELNVKAQPNILDLVAQFKRAKAASRQMSKPKLNDSFLVVDGVSGSVDRNLTNTTTSGELAKNNPALLAEVILKTKAAPILKSDVDIVPYQHDQPAAELLFEQLDQQQSGAETEVAPGGVKVR